MCNFVAATLRVINSQKIKIKDYHCHFDSTSLTNLKRFFVVLRNRKKAKAAPYKLK